MEKEISKEGRESLDRIENGIVGIDGLMIDDEVLKELHQSIALLRRAYDFCDTNLFVLTCVGMLKAGKSTLVSLMAGNKDASPNGVWRGHDNETCANRFSGQGKCGRLY